MNNSETTQPQSTVARAQAYGLDTTLLQLTLTWTPTQRLEALQSMIDFAAEAAQARDRRARSPADDAEPEGTTATPHPAQR